jgi:hypothetical protein
MSPLSRFRGALVYGVTNGVPTPQCAAQQARDEATRELYRQGE